eukprot:gene973-1485_t
MFAIPPEGHDLRKLACMVSQQTVTDFEDVCGVVYCGATGSGKSTAVAIAAGANFIRKNREYHVESCRRKHPATSDGADSKTLHSCVFENEADPSIQNIDTGGLGENRGEIVGEWIQFNLFMLFAQLKTLPALVVVIDVSHAKGTRWGGLAKTVEHFRPFLALTGENRAAIFKSMVFLFTRAIDQEGLMTPDIIRTDVKKAFTTNSNNLKEDLKVKPATHKEATELHNRGILVSFLERISDAPIVVGSPNGEAACEKQREDITRAVSSIQPIDEEKLRRMAGEMPTPFENTLAGLGRLAQHYLAPLETLERQYTGVLAALKSQTRLLQSAREGYVAVKTELLQQLRSVIEDEKKSIARQTSSIDNLRGSTKLLFRSQKTLSVCLTGGFWASTGGGGWANGSIGYDGNFDDYELEGSECVDWDRSSKSVNKSAGTIRYTLESHRKWDLNVNLIVFLRENNHPATLETIERLEKRNRESKQRISDSEYEVGVLSGVSSADSLVAYIISKAGGQKTELHESIKDLNKPLDVPENFPCVRYPAPPSHAQCIKDLAKLVRRCTELGQIFTSRALPTVCKTFSKLLALTDRIEEYRKNPLLNEFFGGSAFTSEALPAQRNTDVQGPKLTAPQEVVKTTTKAAHVVALPSAPAEELVLAERQTERTEPLQEVLKPQKVAEINKQLALLTTLKDNLTAAGLCTKDVGTKLATLTKEKETLLASAPTTHGIMQILSACSTVEELECQLAELQAKKTEIDNSIAAVEEALRKQKEAEIDKEVATLTTLKDNLLAAGFCTKELDTK